MKDLRIPSGAWVVVCDGRKALLLENVGDADYPDLRTRDVAAHQADKTAALGTDKPGTVHQRVGPARSSVGQTDWHQQEEAAFLADMLARLDRAVAAGEVSALVMVAPPRALGTIRKTWSQRVRDAVLTEIDKDLTTIPVDEIERHLVGG